MFEIFMYWVWVTIFSVAILWPIYALLSVGLLAWVKYILSKSTYTRNDSLGIHSRLRSFLNTPLRVLDFRPGDTNGGFRAMALFLSSSFIIISSVGWGANLEGTQGLNWSGSMISLIDIAATFAASVTSWLGLPLLILGGGSWLFIKAANTWNAVTKLLSKDE